MIFFLAVEEEKEEEEEEEKKRLREKEKREKKKKKKTGDVESIEKEKTTALSLSFCNASFSSQCAYLDLVCSVRAILERQARGRRCGPGGDEGAGEAWRRGAGGRKKTAKSERRHHRRRGGHRRRLLRRQMQCCRPSSAAARASAPGRGQRAHRCRDHQSRRGVSQLCLVG